MMREISGLIYNATEEQVVRARNQLKASILFQQDGPGGVRLEAVQKYCQATHIASCSLYQDASSCQPVMVPQQQAKLEPVHANVVRGPRVSVCRDRGGSSIIMACLRLAGVAEDIGRQLLVYGRRIPKAELFARIDAVDEEAVKDVASRFIYDQELALAAVGDCQNLPDYNWFRRRTCVHRPSVMAIPLGLWTARRSICVEVLTIIAR